eukprot:1688875-Rhodomonas_salina.2
MRCQPGKQPKQKQNKTEENTTQKQNKTQTQKKQHQGKQKRTFDGDDLLLVARGDGDDAVGELDAALEELDLPVVEKCVEEGVVGQPWRGQDRYEMG